MKTVITLATLLGLSSMAVAQGFHDPNAPQSSDKPRHEMKQDRKGHKGGQGGFFDESIAVKTVSALKEAKDDSIVMLEGKIIKQVGNDEFIFQDATGEVEVEIGRRAWKGQQITPNDTVQIRGKVDQEWNKTEITVKQVIKK